jgi:uncharacterized protein
MNLVLKHTSFQIPHKPFPIDATLSVNETAEQKTHSQKPLIILAHGFLGFQEWGFLPALANALADAGFAALRFNFSHNGFLGVSDKLTEPERFAENSVWKEHLDFLRVIEFAKDSAEAWRIDAVSIGLYGHSRGGGHAILMTRTAPEVKAVSSWAGISTFLRYGENTLRLMKEKQFVEVSSPQAKMKLQVRWRSVEEYLAHEPELDILAAMHAARIPIQLIHGEEDKTVAPLHAQDLYAANPHHATLRLLPHTSHTFNIAHPIGDAALPKALKTAIAETVAFFSGVMRAR